MAASKQTATEAPTASDAWIHGDQPERITGTVSEVGFAWSDMKESDYVLLHLTDVDVLGGDNIGPRASATVHCFRTVLANEVETKQPLPGEVVTIDYLGLGKNEVRGNRPMIYRVKVHGRSPEQEARGAYARVAGSAQGAQTSAPEDVAIDTAGLDEAPF